MRLRVIRQEPWEAEQLDRVFGRSARPLRSMTAQLAKLGLLSFDQDGRWDLTRVGVAVLDARTTGDWGPLAALTLRAGGMERQVLAFLAEAETAAAQVRLLQARARTVAPALATVVGWQPAWRDGEYFVVPVAVVQTAMTGAAMLIADGRPDWVLERERVGHRAEAYSLRMEREDRGAGALLHVSRDEGDQFGYDLEDVSTQPSRLIECKGSRSITTIFIMSAHELAVARRERRRYEIHYWGQIDLRRTPEADYEELRRADYPRVIPDPIDAIDRGELSVEATAWKVTDTLAERARVE